MGKVIGSANAAARRFSSIMASAALQSMTASVLTVFFMIAPFFLRLREARLATMDSILWYLPYNTSMSKTATTVVKLSADDQQRFAEALIAPAPLTPAMERAISRHRGLIS